MFHPKKQHTFDYGCANVSSHRGSTGHRCHYLDVLCVNVGVCVQQQADDSGVPSQHGPVQRSVLMIFVPKVDGHVECQ